MFRARSSVRSDGGYGVTANEKPTRGLFETGQALRAVAWPTESPNGFWLMRGFRLNWSSQNYRTFDRTPSLTSVSQNSNSCLFLRACSTSWKSNGDMPFC
jgi:hypothetical protein